MTASPARRTADLQRRSRQEADDEAADDAGDEPESGGHTRGDGDAHAQRQRHQEHDDGGE